MENLRKLFSNISSDISSNEPAAYQVHTDCIVLRGNDRYEQLLNIVFSHSTISEFLVLEDKVTCKAQFVDQQSLGFPLPIEIPYDCVRVVLKGREILYENKSLK